MYPPISTTRYTHAYHVPHAEHMERSDKMAMLEVLSSTYPAHGSESNINHWGADLQVVSCRRYLVLRLFVEQLIHLDLF